MFPKYEHRIYPIYASTHVQRRYPARFHKHLEVLAVNSCQLSVTIDGIPYRLQPGDLYVAFPNTLHAIESEGSTVCVMIVDFEKYQAFHDLLLHNRPETPVLRKGQYNPSVLEILERMSQLTKENPPYLQQTLAGYANALLGELLSTVPLVERSTDSTLVQQLVLYILQNYTQPVTLDSIAKALGYSRFHISRSIRTLFGCNLRTLINSYRISMAQNLLLSTNESISTIAQRCGFQNQSSFNRIFISQTGMPPYAYRKQADTYPDKPDLMKRGSLCQSIFPHPPITIRCLWTFPLCSRMSALPESTVF